MSFRMNDQTDTEPQIDAVITWVDGADAAHLAKRATFMGRAGALCENARNPHRWVQSDEIYYCLNAIHTYAPWLRRIWVVVDGQTPDLARAPQALRDRITIVDHREIFRDHLHVLPTFNSLAIESMLWRIEGLAERFIYFNDDVFLTAPLRPRDVFMGLRPVLRGRWVDFSRLAPRGDPALFNHFMQVNAAGMAGYGPERLFKPAHVVHPLRRSVMAGLFDRHRTAFEANIGHRFRHISQFSPQGLHGHRCISDGAAQISAARDHLHITSGQGIGNPAAQTRALLEPAALEGIKFLCVNDLPQLEALVPDARDLIGRAVGGQAENSSKASSALAP